MGAATPASLLSEAERAIASNDLAGALRVSRLFLSRFRSHPRAMAVRTRAVLICIRLGDYEQAVRVGQGAGQAMQREPDLLYAVAQAHVYGGRMDEAIAAVRRTLDADADHPGAIARMVVLLQSEKRTDDAVALLDAAWSRGVNSWDLDHAFAQIAPRAGRAGEAIGRVHQRLASPGLGVSPRRELLMALAELLEKEGDYAASWAAAGEANSLARGAWDGGWHERMIKATIAAFSPEALRALGQNAPSLPTRADLVFVVGMPRSGTTLIEQILSAHPAAESAGETKCLNEAAESLGLAPQVDPGALERLSVQKRSKAGRALRESLVSLAGRDSVVVDKQPFNDRHLGVLAAVAPGARVVLTRRDPRDVALSCYFRNFVGGMDWASDMRAITRLMGERLLLHAHWLGVLPAHAPWIGITEARYETVVADARTEARRLVSFAGLEWDDACLRFDERARIMPTLLPAQAGMGVYTGSVARWKRFEPFVGSAFDGLHEMARRLDYQA